MADNSAIEWTDATWNPVTGCTKVSPGCDHCYAERIVERFKGKGAFEQVTLNEDRLAAPLHWRKPRRVFVNSMSDLFHDAVPDDYIASVFAVMAATPQHTYQILTKRHGRMRSLLSSPDFKPMVALAALEFDDAILSGPYPLPNVWLGVSVEDQKRADLRIPALLDTPAAVRFLSCEPLLGPVDLDQPRCQHHDRDEVYRDGSGQEWCNDCIADGSTGELSYGHWLDPLNGGINWVIVGGESGPGARPMHPDWARTLRDQCTSADVPFFFKQWGEWKSAPSNYGPNVPDRARASTELLFRNGSDVDGQIMLRAGKHQAGRELDGRTWDEYPQEVFRAG